jgi:hypothetical protein
MCLAINESTRLKSSLGVGDEMVRRKQRWDGTNVGQSGRCLAICNLDARAPAIGCIEAGDSFNLAWHTSAMLFFWKVEEGGKISAATLKCMSLSWPNIIRQITL